MSACKLVDVEPRFAKLPVGSDPLAYIESMDTRRHVSKGARAMATAIRYPDENQRGRGHKSRATKGELNSQFTLRRLQQARMVLRYSRQLADSVVKGVTPLNEALATVQQQMQYQMGDEAKLARLHL